MPGCPLIFDPYVLSIEVKVSVEILSLDDFWLAAEVADFCFVVVDRHHSHFAADGAYYLDSVHDFCTC
jgi:hypothetical protein